MVTTFHQYIKKSTTFSNTDIFQDFGSNGEKCQPGETEFAIRTRVANFVWSRLVGMFQQEAHNMRIHVKVRQYVAVVLDSVVYSQAGVDMGKSV